MVYIAYLGKEHGIAKTATTVLGAIIVGTGCHGYFTSPWVKNKVHEICNEIQSLKENETERITTPTSVNFDLSCPSLAMEKCSIIIILFCFTLSLSNLTGSLFSKQFSQGVFKLGDIIFHATSGVLLIIAGSLFIYSSVQIDKVQKTISELKFQCNVNGEGILSYKSYQLYEEKLAAGSLSIFNGVLYFVVTGLLFIS